MDKSLQDVEHLALLLEAAQRGDVQKDKYGDEICFTEYRKNVYLTHNGDQLKRIIILLSGKVEVFKYSAKGKSLRTGTVDAPQVFGLYELACGIGEYTATLQAATNLTCAEVRPHIYKKALTENLAVSQQSLILLASFTNRMLNRTDMLTLLSPRENLLMFFYEACKDGVGFQIIAEPKMQIAERLNMNLRTLYRQLEGLEDEGIISRRKGKIQISIAQRRRIISELVLN